MIEKMTPGKYQPYHVWNKAYWNFTKRDWKDWLKSFSTLPIREYNSHIGSCLDMYCRHDFKELQWHI